MTMAGADPVATARRLADEVLFPAALATDAADSVPVELLDQLADAGFYGLLADPAFGGLGVDRPTGWAVIEALASGCLTTTFVWLQHLATSTMISATPGPLRDALAADLCRGRRRSGIAFAHLRRPDPPPVVAHPAEGGWVVDGTVPLVTGWGLIDYVQVAARHGDDVVWLLVDAVAAPTMEVSRLALGAVNASVTMAMKLRGHVVPTERLSGVESLAAWLERDAAGLRSNASLGLGVSARCLQLLGRSQLDDELAALRVRVNGAEPGEMPQARAEVSLFTIRAASALVAATGGASMVRNHHAQRLAREAMFLLVQGQTPAMRAEQRRLLGGAASVRPSDG